MRQVLVTTVNTNINASLRRLLQVSTIWATRNSYFLYVKGRTCLISDVMFYIKRSIARVPSAKCQLDYRNCPNDTRFERVDIQGCDCIGIGIPVVFLNAAALLTPDSSARTVSLCRRPRTWTGVSRYKACRFPVDEVSSKTKANVRPWWWCVPPTSTLII